MNTITIELTDEEAKALGQLSDDTDLPQDRVMIQALHLYQSQLSDIPETGKMQMNTEVIDRLYLELSQFTRAKTKREIELEELVRSACCIAERRGENTAWGRYIASAAKLRLNGITARTYRVLQSDGQPNH